MWSPAQILCSSPGTPTCRHRGQRHSATPQEAHSLASRAGPGVHAQGELRVGGDPGLRARNQSRGHILEPDVHVPALLLALPRAPAPAPSSRLCYVKTRQSPGHCEYCKCGFEVLQCGDPCMSLVISATSPRDRQQREDPGTRDGTGTDCSGSRETRV